MDRQPESSEAELEGAHARFLAGLALVAAIALWIPPIGSSFRLDETATHWLIRDGVGSTIDRAAEFQGETPLYYLIQSGTKGLLGTSEAVLRIPSLVAMAGAAFLLYRLGSRLAGREVGLMAAVLLVTMEDMIFAAGDARPYALAILALIAATLALVRWVDDQRATDAILYVVLATSAMYMHYLSGLALLAHPFYVFRRRDRLSPLRFSFAALGIAVLMLPTVPHLRSLYVRRESLEVSFGVSLPNLFGVLIPTLLVGSAVLGVVVARLWDRVGRTGSGSAGAWALASMWWVLPSLLLFVISTVSAITLFEPRFFFFSAPGLALVGGMAIRALDPPRARRIVATAIVAISVIGFASRTHAGDDWRSAASTVRSLAGPDTPVLLRTAFIESNQFDWLTRPDKVSYLLAPLSPYPMGGDIVLLPYIMSSEADRYLGRVVERKLSSAEQFVLVNDYGGFQSWLLGRLPSFSARTLTEQGSVAVVLFKRNSS